MYPSTSVSNHYDGFITLMEPMPVPMLVIGGVESFDRTREYGVNPYRLGEDTYRALLERFGEQTE
ncbi:MAG: hypothetical protein K2X93_00520 [Candidatus Obscuribacterales bacterium]|nr:hypothetical protein [Candidatus Obscuribacterales bacterium]